MSLHPDQGMPPLATSGTILLCMIFGANAVAIKVSLTGLGPFTAAGIRFTVAVVAITLWARATGRSLKVAREDIRPLAILCVLFTAQLSLFYLGVSRTLATRSALIVNVVPFFVLLLAHCFLPDDRINRRKIIGMIMGFIGVGVVLADRSALGGGWRTGDAIVLMAATIWACNAVYTKTIIHRFSAFQVVLYPMICAAPVQFLEGWIWDKAMWVRFDGAIAAAMLYQSLICATFGFVAWNGLLRRYGATTLHSFIFIMPISGVAAGGLILKEPITFTLMAAAALVALGILIVNAKPRQPPPVTPLGRSF